MKKLLFAVIMLSVLLASCAAPAPAQPEVIKETVIVETEKEVVVTAVPEETKPVVKVGIVVHGQPPVRYYVDGDPMKGLAGYEVDVMRNVAECMGVELETYDVAWAGLFAGLLSGKWDWAASSVFIRQDREEMMDFSDPYQDSDIAFMKPKGTQLDTFEDLKGKVLCADTGAGSEIWLRDNLEKYGPYTIQTYSGIQNVWNDVLAGRCDGGLGDSPTMEYFVKDYPDQLDRGLYLGVGYKVGIAFRPDDPMIPEFNACLREMKTSGQLAELYETHFGVAPHPDSAVVDLFETKYVPDK
jgi:polar amino acid transport system substrate-binding protein